MKVGRLIQELERRNQDIDVKIGYVNGIEVLFCSTKEDGTDDIIWIGTEDYGE